MANVAIELRRLEQTRLPAFLVQLMFAYLENTYFSEWWWDTLSASQKAHVVGLVRTEPSYFPVDIRA